MEIIRANTMEELAGTLARRIQDHENPGHYGSGDPAFVRFERNGSAMLFVIAENEPGANITGSLPSTPYFDTLLREASALEAEADNGLRVFIHIENVKDETDMEEIVKAAILVLTKTTELVSSWFNVIRAVPEQSGSFLAGEGL